MGCDGGTIPTRDELVKLKKKPEKKDKFSDLSHKWQNCAISQEPLRRPIVACELGRLYNKDIVIELLLDKTKFECAASFDHIRGLKDVKVLQLAENPAHKDEDHKGQGYAHKTSAKYICPISGLEMNGRHRFSFLWKCGCVFSERALKEVKTETCHQCGLPCSNEDVIIVMNGSEEESESLRTAMDERRLQAKLEKKAKKGHRKAEEALGSADGPSKKLQKMSEQPSTSKSNENGPSKLVGANGTTSKLAKGSKLASGAPTIGSKLPGKSDGKQNFKTFQEDPNKSKAYKSLFTTHEKAKNQTKAHWVTYNPCFY